MAGVTTVWVRYECLKDEEAYRKTKFDLSFTQLSISASVDNGQSVVQLFCCGILTMHQLPLVHAVDVAQEAIQPVVVSMTRTEREAKGKPALDPSLRRVSAFLPPSQPV
jgi:hypothetical protein